MQKISLIPSRDSIMHILLPVIFINILNRAGQRLIMINHIQNKSFCIHNVSVYTVYIYYLYINTHKCIYLRKLYLYII